MNEPDHVPLLEGYQAEIATAAGVDVTNAADIIEWAETVAATSENHNELLAALVGVLAVVERRGL
ncbi:MAG TPA: hypothetical protein VED63_12600 [Acidimicrobiales bacterium]|nr:hypothetical protein [Acidimicrobiales bacterium]